MVERLANTIAPDNNPRAQVSILIDNGVIQNPIYYKNDNEYEAVKRQAINKLVQEKKNAGIEKTEPTKEELATIELSIIKNQQGADGIINPVLTKKQRDEARERVKQSVDIQLAEKIQKDMPNIVRGDGNTNTNTPKPVDYSQYERMADAWKNGNINVLSSFLSNKTNKIQRVAGSGFEITDQYGSTLFGPSKSLEELIPYFYSNPNTGFKQREAWLQATGGGSQGGGRNNNDPLNLGID
jgi:hypothetical protein